MNKNSIASFLTINKDLSHPLRLCEALKIVFLNPLYRKAIKEIFDKTRNHDYGLLLCNISNEILKQYAEKFLEKEYRSIDMYLINLRLHCLDKTDRWNGYVEYFQEVVESKDYHDIYAKSVNSGASRFGKFLLDEDDKYLFVHFLYSKSYRYELIRKKIRRSTETNKLGNLKHRTQDELTDKEIENRFKEIIRFVELEENCK